MNHINHLAQGVVKINRYHAARRALGLVNQLTPGRSKARWNADVMRKLNQFRNKKNVTRKTNN